MKIYTRTGDDGTTGLIGGQRIDKSDARIECIGDIDELNAFVGWCAVIADASFLPQLQRIQRDLFSLGSRLAVPDEATADTLPSLDDSAIGQLESEIDASQAHLPELRNFILPGGTELAARLHLTRTICRRAERSLVKLSEHHAMPPTALKYLNRLSDWLFVKARLANSLAGASDVLWTP